MTPDILNLLENNTRSEKVRASIQGLETYRSASSLCANVSNKKKDIKRIVEELSVLQDCPGRSLAVLEMIKRWNCRIENDLGQYDLWWDNAQGCFRHAVPLFEMLTQNDLQALVFHICSLDDARPGDFSGGSYKSADDIMLMNTLMGLIKDDAVVANLLAKRPWENRKCYDWRVERHRNYTCELCRTLFTRVQGDELAWKLFRKVDKLNKADIAAYFFVVQKLSPEHMSQCLTQASENLKRQKGLSFAGFYCGMPVRDFVVLCAKNDALVDAGLLYRASDSVKSLEFDRKSRYKVFGTEDDEFWSDFLKKYVPRNKNGRWGTKADSDWLTNNSSYEYTSIKHQIKITYNEKDGSLKISTWNP